jgi:hypothetical protein
LARGTIAAEEKVAAARAIVTAAVTAKRMMMTDRVVDGFEDRFERIESSSPGRDGGWAGGEKHKTGLVRWAEILSNHHKYRFVIWKFIAIHQMLQSLYQIVK